MGGIIGARPTRKQIAEEDEILSAVSGGRKECSESRARKRRAAAVDMGEQLAFVDALERGDKARMEMGNKKIELARM